MPDDRWRWSPSLIGWALHSRLVTAFLAYERRAQDPELPPVAAMGAAGAQRFRVAIVSPAGVERYWLRGSLDECRAKLAAALARRQAAPPRPPADDDELDWRRDGPWYAPFREARP